MSKTSTQVLERMMLLIDTIAAHPEALNLKRIAEITGLHTATTHRILNDLVACRLLDRYDANTYRLGIRLLELGALVKSRIDVRISAQEHMRRLHRATGQTINLAIRQGDEIVYIERSFSERSGVQVVRAIGGRAPLHLTSTGKLFLSVEDDTQVKAYAQRTNLTGNTPNSLTNIKTLKAELAKVREQHFARDNEELELGVRCIAAGIYDDSAKLIAGLSLSAPAQQLQEAWLPQIQQTAQLISRAIGFVNWEGQ